MTDKIAAALVRGMNIHGNSLTVKHFAAKSVKGNIFKVV